MAKTTVTDEREQAVAPAIVLLGHAPARIPDYLDMCAAERWHPVEAGTLRELWALVDSGVPWIIVLPATVEGVPARDICHELRQRSGGRYIPVVAVLRLETADDQADALLAGIDVCLSVRSGVDALRSEIRRLLSLAAETRQLDARWSLRRSAAYAGERRRRSDPVEQG